MGISSARPGNLEQCAARSRAADGELHGHERRLKSAYREFQAGTEWGSLDMDSLLSGFAAFIDYNETDAGWLDRIAFAFREAGGDGAIKRLPDAAIRASLRAAGLLGGRRSVTFDDPVAYGMPATSGYANDPVNTATGNFVEVESDLPWAGLRRSLRFERVYNSRSTQTGAFGTGWSSWADVRLHLGPDGAQYTGPDGQRALFPRLGEGYGRVVGVAALLEPTPVGTALGWFSGERWEFDEAGLPVRVTLGPGTGIELTYHNGRLAALTHVAGAQTRLDWDGERVARLHSSDGRSVVYRYSATGDLVGAGGRSYTLDEHRRVTEVVDADGVAETVNRYDDAGRVLAQLSPFGRQTMFGYLPGAVTVTGDEQGGPDNIFIHDEHGRLQAVVDGEGARLAISYDEWGNPVAFTDRNGAVAVSEWDDRAHLRRQTQPSGTDVAIAYDDLDRVVAIAEQVTGTVTRLQYRADERTPATVTDPEGHVTSLTVEDGLVRRVVDPDGVALSFDYDAQGNIVGVVDGAGAVTRIEVDPAGLPAVVVSPLGRRTALRHEDGRLVERIDPAGGVWRYEYSDAGRLIAQIDPTGARKEIHYGEHGAQEAVVDALGHVLRHGYDLLGNLVVSVAPSGRQWSFEYDGVCRLTRIVDPAGGAWLRGYNADGGLTTAVDPTGAQRRATFDPAGRTTEIGDGLTSMRLELDVLGRATAIRLADGSEIHTEYDRCGRPTVVYDPSGAQIRHAYTPGGRLSRVVDGVERARATYHYDVCGRIAAVIDGAGRRRACRYDADGAIVEITDATGVAERFLYDAAGRLVTRETPGAGLTSLSYDAAGRVAATTDRNFGTRRFDYDAVGRLVAATDANGATTHLGYDADGALTDVRDPLGMSVTRDYDDNGRLTTITDQLGRTTTRVYDAAGRIVERTDGAGVRLVASYDGAGRLRSYGAPGEAPTAIEHDDLGRPILIEEPGSFAHRLRYDAAGRLVERRRAEVALQWSYDDSGNRAAMEQPDDSATTYSYDAGGLLTGFHHPVVGAVEFERDPAGRLIGACGDGLHATWAYENGDLTAYEQRTATTTSSARLERDPLGRVVRVIADGAERRFAYDAAGQLVRADNVSFEYDAAGRIVRERGPSDDVRNEYDAAGQLVRRESSLTGATTYDYDGAGRRIRQRAGDELRVLRWDVRGRLSAIETRAHTTRLDIDALGELAALDETPLLWDTADPFSPLVRIGERAAVGPRAPWASVGCDEAEWHPRDWQGTEGGPHDTWGVSGAPQRGAPRVGYRGELEFDGAIWLRNRVYDPATRSFLSPDPLPPILGTASASNPYHYAANNPLGLLDPLGLRPLSENELAAIAERMAQAPGWLNVLSGFWTGVGVDFVSATLQGIAPWAVAAYATRVSGYYRSGTMVRGHWRTTPGGGRVWVAPHMRSSGPVSPYLRGNATTGRWTTAGGIAGPLGTIFSGVAGGIDQFGEDEDRGGLSTTDRVGRTAGAAAGSAGLSLGGGLAGASLGGRGGAALGATVGSAFPVIGTAVGGAVGGTIGAIGGGVIGSGAGSWVADQVSDGFAAGGQAVANTAVDAWDHTEGVRDTVGGALDAINPF